MRTIETYGDAITAAREHTREQLIEELEERFNFPLTLSHNRYSKSYLVVLWAKTFGPSQKSYSH